MFDTLGRYSNVTYRMIFANLWLFGGVWIPSAVRAAGVNALMRTTVPLAQAKGSAGRNVIPPEATFISNLAPEPPEDTMDSALAYLKRPSTTRQSRSPSWGMNPSRISETNCPA